MLQDDHPYQLLNATQATHKFRHPKGKANSSDYKFLYKIKHLKDGSIVKWQSKDIQNYIDRQKVETI
ncbi:hypothetical protein [Oenococcus oeni]|uniref:hypothetical protein n=1 Tax=Oenococcus oeni TaxID=1247 RepID=UPI0008F7FAD1|nr:hypothetical protein [Oenococcus oeni]OIM85599.1 hypothetical protein ATX99_02280 [Oenococcus oeni]